ncbi:MAG: hypothetical protein EOP04_33505, partial [Proteobacteria bacterium]
QYQVTPFGNLRIKACLPLPEAYRSLSRPSSPVSTKASTVCPLKLDSIFRNQPLMRSVDSSIGLIYFILTTPVLVRSEDFINPACRKNLMYLGIRIFPRTAKNGSYIEQSFIFAVS